MLMYAQFKAKLHKNNFLPGEGRVLQFSLTPLSLSSLSYKICKVVLTLIYSVCNATLDTDIPAFTCLGMSWFFPETDCISHWEKGLLSLTGVDGLQSALHTKKQTF